jgi:hypothetical protein
VSSLRFTVSNASGEKKDQSVKKSETVTVLGDGLNVS